MEASEAEKALQNIIDAKDQFVVFYTSLVEKGIEETNYSEPLSKITNNFGDLYAKSKSNYDALQHDKDQFEQGFMDPSSFEKRLVNLEPLIHNAEFKIQTQILPYIKKIEKELLQNHIIEVVEASNLPEDVKSEIKVDAAKIKQSMVAADLKKDSTEQVKEYIGIGGQIMKLGNKVWEFAKPKLKEAAPYVIPGLLNLFKPT
jgi:hypothetical protein